MNILIKINRSLQRAFYGLDDYAMENPDNFTTDFYFFMANAKINYIEENEDLTNKDTLKEFKMLQDIAFGMAGYNEMCSGEYKKSDPEFKRLEKEFKKAWKLLGDNMTILW